MFTNVIPNRVQGIDFMTIARQISAALVVLLTAAMPASRAADREAIKKAIDRGVEYLRSQQKPDGSWEYKVGKEGIALAPQQVGATALAGLALLECGVDPADAALQKAAQAIRQGSIRHTSTYSIALAVLFLDRLDEDGDEPLIQSLIVRLLAGQNNTAGWSYMCPPISDAEALRLIASLRNPRPRDSKRSAEAGRILLPREIREQLAQINAGGVQVPGYGMGDHSNTQFATIALWVGRRHGMPVDKALRAIDARFRKLQNRDGGWQYMPMTLGTSAPGFSKPSMTCAGLLGLAVAAGATNEAVLRTGRKSESRQPTDWTRDPAVQAGLLALGTFLDRAAAIEQQRIQAAANLPGQPPPGGAGAAGDPLFDHYFLWSLERVALIYGLETIGTTNWYEYGSQRLLRTQQREGGWFGTYGEVVETSFCLLLLRRSNVAHDLSASLKSGGVGGESLKERQQTATAKPGRENAPPAPTAVPANSEAGSLAAQLVASSGEKQDTLIEKLQESKGATYTEALATAIPQLDGAAKRKVRTALARRMARMTAVTLKDRLQDEDLEIRRASALACAMKEEKGLIPDLIKLLEDSEPPVYLAAHAALKDLSGKDFGPGSDASRAERSEAARQWKTWWSKNKPGG
jgi:hypothetical protein